MLQNGGGVSRVLNNTKLALQLNITINYFSKNKLEHNLNVTLRLEYALFRNNGIFCVI